MVYMAKDDKTYLGKRYEFKYAISPKKAQLLQHYIEAVGLLRDSNSKDGGYIVNSLYFETHLLDDYYDKDASLLVRKKMRARMYEKSWADEHPHVWVEVKGKRNFSISKSRSKVEGESFQKFLTTNNPRDLILGEKDKKDEFEKFTYLYAKGNYKPHVIIRYDRLAFTDTFTDNVRVTFDSNIGTTFAGNTFGELFMDKVFPDTVIMEVKFVDRLPWWFTKMIDMYDLKRTDFSKYNHSVATLRHSYRIPVSR